MPRKGRARRFREARELKQGYDDGLFGEDCVELKDGGFNDHGCGSLEYYLCECDGRAEDPDAF